MNPQRRRAISLRGAGAAPILLVLLTACSPGETETLPAVEPRAATSGPHLLLVTIDTLRADHCSSYGYHRETTPVLDALAADGARFETVYAPMGVTGPSHATLFTSLHPQVHGLMRNGLRLRDEPPVLAGLLRDHGYRTAAFVGSFVLDRRFGQDRGFDHYDDEFSGKGETFPRERWEGVEVQGVFDRRAEETTDRALAWLVEQDGSAPFFLWVHYFDPHRPYLPRPPFDERFRPEAGATPLERDIADYDGEVAYADAELGRLLAGVEAALGADTLVVVTADHGEGLMDHGWPTHGPLLYEEDVRVPLVVRWPDRVTPGRVLSSPAALIDLTPTVLDLLSVPRDHLVLQGVSLAPRLLGGATGDSERPLYMIRRDYETRRMSLRIASGSEERVAIEMKGRKLAVRKGPWKYIEARAEGTQELYALSGDPGERRNLASERPDDVRELSGLLAAWSDRQAELAPRVGGTLSPEDEEALRSLGYVP